MDSWLIFVYFRIIFWMEVCAFHFTTFWIGSSHTLARFGQHAGFTWSTLGDLGVAVGVVLGHL